ncbi:MAG: YcxB family protein [Lachnospiraceae bacterium]|nr:YcxB family protein [Lachnospiraceae bacterium]
MNFEVETTRTFEEYEKYNKVVYEKLYKIKRIRIIFFVVYFLILIVLSLPKNYAEAIVVVLIAGISVFITRFITRFFVDRDIKKTYETNTLMKDAKVLYKFSEDRVESHSPIGIEVLEYSKMYKLIETDTNFYMMIAKNMGFIISKANMTKEQIEFVRGLEKKQ